MNVPAATRAGGRPGRQLALEIGLHVQELQPEHLRLNRERVIGPAPPRARRVGNPVSTAIGEIVGLSRLLGYGVDGTLEDRV